MNNDQIAQKYGLNKVKNELSIKVMLNKKTLIRYSVQGWRLKSAFTNEIGTNMIGTAIVGVGVGSNTTSDEVVLIFERKIRGAKKEL